MKKKVLVLAAAMMVAVSSAKAAVEFAYEAGAEIVSSYLWRGQYNGGLSFQPDLEIGYDGEISSFRVGAWGNIGASDYKFKKDPGDGTGYTMFMPEVDIMASFSIIGISVGFNHYYYFRGSNFLSWKSVADLDANPDKNSSTTEVWAGFNLNHLVGQDLYVNWYTTVAGQDLKYDDALNPSRAYSSYLEVGYNYCMENIGLTIGAQVGMSPWASEMYGNSKFAVTNVTLRLDKEWEVGPCAINLFAQGSVNPDGINKNNLFINEAGYDKLYYQQKLNGCIGLGFWF